MISSVGWSLMPGFAIVCANISKSMFMVWFAERRYVQPHVIVLLAVSCTGSPDPVNVHPHDQPSTEDTYETTPPGPVQFHSVPQPIVFPDEHVLQMLCVPVRVSAPHWLFVIQYFPRVIDAPRVLVLFNWGMFAEQVPAPHVPPEHLPMHSLA